MLINFNLELKDSTIGFSQEFAAGDKRAVRELVIVKKNELSPRTHTIK